MATNRNIQMNYYNGTNYDVLYPQSTIAQISNLQSTLNSKLNLSGGTMTGDLILSGTNENELSAITKQYVDNIATEKTGLKLLKTYSLNMSINRSTFYYYVDIGKFDNIDFDCFGIIFKFENVIWTGDRENTATLSLEDALNKDNENGIEIATIRFKQTTEITNTFCSFLPHVTTMFSLTDERNNILKENRVFGYTSGSTINDDYSKWLALNNQDNYYICLSSISSNYYVNSTFNAILHVYEIK